MEGLGLEGLLDLEAVVVLVGEAFIAYTAPAFFDLTYFVALFTHLLQVSITKELDLFLHRQCCEGLTFLILTWVVGGRHGSTNFLDLYLDL